MSDSKFHKRFDPEYKKEIVRLVEELGKSPVEVAKAQTSQHQAGRRGFDPLRKNQEALL